jgi:hypothetical protein
MPKASFRIRGGGGRSRGATARTTAATATRARARASATLGRFLLLLLLLLLFLFAGSMTRRKLDIVFVQNIHPLLRRVLPILRKRLAIHVVFSTIFGGMGLPQLISVRVLCLATLAHLTRGLSVGVPTPMSTPISLLLGGIGVGVRLVFSPTIVLLRLLILSGQLIQDLIKFCGHCVSVNSAGQSLFRWASYTLMAVSSYQVDLTVPTSTCAASVTSSFRASNSERRTPLLVTLLSFS